VGTSVVRSLTFSGETFVLREKKWSNYMVMILKNETLGEF